MSVRQTNTKLTQQQIEDLYAYFLKLDQTTVQSVINGSPKFQEGITIKDGNKLILDGA